MVRSSDTGGAADSGAIPKPGEVEARPIADFAPAVKERRVAFLKIDVEGFELHGAFQKQPFSRVIFELF